MIANIQGKIFVVDFKTMKSGGQTQDIFNKLQAILYTLAYKELYGKLSDGFMQIGLVGLKTPKVIPILFVSTPML